jgi:hypothetical protein
MPFRQACVAAALWLCAACASTAPALKPAAARHERWAFGVDVQAYPAGAIVAVETRRPVSERGELGLRAGYNLTQRGDFGEHDDEDGGGPGVGVGYRHLFAPRGTDGWLTGARVDLWSLDIDWEDDPSGSAPAGREGSTDVLVLQPTAELGYGWWLGRGRVELVLAVGAEINVDTDGEDVGEGAIALLGFTYLF